MYCVQSVKGLGAMTGTLDRSIDEHLGWQMTLDGSNNDRDRSIDEHLGWQMTLDRSSNDWDLDIGR